MTSTRKSRNVNKRFAKINEEWSEKDGTNANKSKMRKRKLSDMLGTQWSEEELERFYEAYRKYGKDWKKVAGATRNRSAEMVEALYNMNRAYLSLPEGTATAAGLIAMMTDHYNILEGSDSGHESNEVSRISRKPQSHGRGKFRLMSKGSSGRYPDLLQYQSGLSTSGCLSLLKKKRSGDLFSGTRPRAVGKRTPRVPVLNMYSKDVRDRILSPNKQTSKSVSNTVDDEGAHVAALALAEVSQRGGSPQLSRTPGRRADRMRSSPAKSGERKNAESEMDGSKLMGVQMEGECHEGSLGSRGAENGDFAGDAHHLVENEGAGAVETQRKVKKPQGKRRKAAADMGNDQFDDDREACSGTEEGSHIRKNKYEIDIGTMEGKTARGSKSSRKSNSQLFFGDESSGLDALQTLADLSVNILLPASTVESESSFQVKEQKRNIDTAAPIPESMSTTHQSYKSKVSVKKERGHFASVGTAAVTRKSAKPGKGLLHDANAISEVKQQNCAGISKIQKKRLKSSTGKALKGEFDSDFQKFEPQKTQVSAAEGKGPINKTRRVGQVNSPPKQGKLVKPQENSSSSTDLTRPVIDSNETIVQASTNPGNLVAKSMSRRKIGLQKALASKEFKSNESAVGDHPDKYSYPVSRVVDFKEKLSHCLSSKMLRRWCMFEWFYSAIDYPWFAKSEFVEYLNHVRLGHIPRLTRVEWGVIRSSLGKPRRLSKQFLQEEREKLERYRESVRKHYAELRAGVREGLPTDLARSLSVGQRVIACHPKTREIHDGSILTVDHNRCRVQFDRPELGVELVLDIDCMPLNPLENIPEALRRQNIVANKFSTSFSDTKLDDRSKEWKIEGSAKYAPTKSLDIVNGPSSFASSNYPMNTLMKQAKADTIDAIVQAKATVNEAVVAVQQAMYSQPCTLSQIQEREADIRVLAELSRALDKKEALLVELRHMNEEVYGKQKDGDYIKDLENFRKQYAMVLVQLRDANDQVASTLLSLRQRNTYHGNSTHPWVRPIDNSGGPSGPLDSSSSSAILNQDSGSRIAEIVESSRQKARTMVDAAVQAMCALKGGEDAFTKIGEALDSANNRISGSGSSVFGVRHNPPDPGHGSSAYQDHTSCMPEATTIHGFSPKFHISSDSEIQLPSELISSCVSTLLMIQACTERQYPPAEIAQILDSAVASLQPCCLQNLPIYREIETCMGIIKNQMLALIPTPSIIPPVEVPIVQK